MDAGAIDEAIELETTVAAPIEQVWAAWAEADRLVEWDPERVDGTFAPGATIRYAWPSLEVARELEVVRFEPPRHLALIAHRPEPRQSLALALTPTPGGTRIELGFAGFESADQRAGAFAGWRVQLALVRRYLERHFASPRSLITRTQPVAAARADLWALLGTPAGLGAWLGEVSGDVHEGTRIAIDAGPALRIEGEVLARVPPYELAVAGDELAGALRLRCLPLLSPGPTLAVAQLSLWGGDDDRRDAAATALDAALSRLIASIGGSSGRA